MAAGDLLSASRPQDQYEVQGLLMGTTSLAIGEAGVSGWETVGVEGVSVKRDLANGVIVGFDTLGAQAVTVPLLIVASSETAARASLALVRAAWSPPTSGVQDVELHRMVDGVHEYMVGRVRGCAPVMTWVKQGAIPVLCSFLGTDGSTVEVAP